MLTTKHLAALTVAFSVAAGLTLLTVHVKAQAVAPTPIGAWFGIARPCTTNSRFQPPSGTVNQEVCRDACLGAACPASNFPVDEVTMIPTLLADGTVLADDFAELIDGHTTAQGKWEFAGKAVIGGKSVDRYQASFLWFSARNRQDIDPSSPLSIFNGIIRPRFVTFWDVNNPDIMQGFIQPYVYSMTDRFGIVLMQPGLPWPAVDPMARLPVTCDPGVLSNPYCAGTLTFNIRRIPAH
jgi:hypothetical protein